jgi:hypothetical protein
MNRHDDTTRIDRAYAVTLLLGLAALVLALLQHNP